MLASAKELEDIIKLAIDLSTDNFIGAAVDVYLIAKNAFTLGNCCFFF
jgi:hypothetical protein